MILARLLEPSDFGLVGMVTSVTGVVSMFRDAGLSTATIQRVTITNEQISTLFWVNILVGAILGVILLASAPILVSFYQEPRLFWVTVAIASGFLFSAAGVQHSVLLERQMRFVTLSLIEILALFFSIAIGIVMAIGGFAYWALVGMAVCSTVAYTVGVWVTSGWTPGMPHRRVGIPSMLRFGATITLNNIVGYISYNLDKVLLGRFCGANALGLYDRAYQLINIPTANINAAIGGVALSALSRLQGDPIRLKSYFLKGYSLVLALSLPITMACALFSDDIVYIFLGPKWMDAVTIFRLFAPTVLVFALMNPLWWLLVSTGNAVRSLKIALVLAPLLIAAYIMGLPYGPTGVAMGFTAVMLFMVLPIIIWAIHGTMISIKDIWQSASRPFISALVAAVIAFTAYMNFSQCAPPFARLLLGCSILFASYLCMLLFVMGQRAFYLDLLRELSKAR
jgi:O-antigen/teichoic acid export membrane protein